MNKRREKRRRTMAAVHRARRPQPIPLSDEERTALVRTMGESWSHIMPKPRPLSPFTPMGGVYHGIIDRLFDDLVRDMERSAAQLPAEISQP